MKSRYHRPLPNPRGSPCVPNSMSPWVELESKKEKNVIFTNQCTTWSQQGLPRKPLKCLENLSPSPVTRYGTIRGTLHSMYPSVPSLFKTILRLRIHIWNMRIWNYKTFWGWKLQNSLGFIVRSNSMFPWLELKSKRKNVKYDWLFLQINAE